MELAQRGAGRAGGPWQSFHTVCAEAVALFNVVPPVLTTLGCEPGSSMANGDGSWLSGKQSSDPASPEAAIMV